jgi:hypothetical protein
VVKPLTMSEGREGVARALHAHEGGIGPCLGCELLAEIDALRRLPVIATCEACPHGNAAEGRQLYCFHPSASRETDGNPRMVKRAVPPSWCPWRGTP